MSLSAAALLGLGMGVKHTLEADHLAAVCTFVARGKGFRQAALAGVSWAAGHALTLVVASGALVYAGVTMPETLAIVFDIAVAIMLVGLGAGSLAQSRRQPDPQPRHLQPGEPHPATMPSRKRSFAVGLVHGASGTAALTLLVATTLPDRAHALGYIVTFSASSVVAMPLAAAIVAWGARAWLGRTTRRAVRIKRVVAFQRVAGYASIAAGVLLLLGTLQLPGISS